MLVLQRHRDESIIITAGGERIVVTVVDIRGDRVRIGFSASPEVIIDREEIDRKRKAEGIVAPTRGGQR